MDLTNTMVCWNPGTTDVALVPWPDTQGRSRLYDRSGGACYTEVRTSDFETRKAQVFIEAVHLIVRDHCAPQAVHRALCGLEEYRAGCADDMPINGGL